MKNITFQEFLNINKKNKIISFSTSFCKMCAVNKENLKDQDIIFVSTDNDEDLAKINIGIVPATFIYDENEKIVYKKFGVLYSSQITELIDQYNRMLERQLKKVS